MITAAPGLNSELWVSDVFLFNTGQNLLVKSCWAGPVYIY